MANIFLLPPQFVQGLHDLRNVYYTIKKEKKNAFQMQALSKFIATFIK